MGLQDVCPCGAGLQEDDLRVLSFRHFVSLPQKPHMTFDTSHASLAILYITDYVYFDACIGEVALSML